MPNTYLIDIGLNDNTQDIVRKCNHNFRRLASDQSQLSKLGLRQEAQRADAVIAGTIDEINAAIADGLKQIEDALDQIMVDLTPPIGTWMFADYDPNKKYPNTTWEKISEGTFLMSAGSTYEENESYGSNEVTLTVDQMPSHSHRYSSNWSYVGWDNNSPVAFATIDEQDRVTDKDHGNWNQFDNTYDDQQIISNTGGNQPHSNIPQSIAVPLWHRTK